MKKIAIFVTHTLLMSSVFLFSGCKITYGFTGGSLDYSKYKSISIADFPNNAELVNPTLAQTFTEALRDKYTRQTRLQVLKQGGDLQLEGEIVGYQLAAKAISADSYAAETELTLTVNVRFTNVKSPEEGFNDVRYSSSQLFDNSKQLSQVESELVDLLVKDIIDKIYNDTVAKW